MVVDPILQVEGVDLGYGPLTVVFDASLEVGRGELVGLETAPICVNPVTGATAHPRAEARQHSGATNATGLEWGARPALTGRLISTECRGGLLWHSAPDADFLTAGGSWADRRKIVPYNLFYGDIERDVATRVNAWRRRNGA